MPKKTTSSKKTHVKKKRRFLGEAKGGALYVVAILGIVSLFGGVLAGGAVPTITKLTTAPPPGEAYSCCDSGDGAACHPIMEQSFTYKGQQYALLKSNIYQGESDHLAPTNDYTPQGNRIFENSSDRTANYSGRYVGCEHGKDLIGINHPEDIAAGLTGRDRKHRCGGIPNDALIYVCKETAAKCAQNINIDAVPFDVYYRISDGPVPIEINSYCPKPSAPVIQSSQEVVLNVTPDGKKRLQLETFTVKQEQSKSKWLGAWCKPAIYLYPEQKTQVHVQVAPKGKFNLTIPQYPENGWKVTAYPDGRVVDNNVTYPYLYWEAAIPDKLINEPKDGYVVTQDELEGLFTDILPKLGLNEKESSEFSEYWLKALPKSNYYFVGVLPVNEIDYLAPLKISPQPDSILRVTLFFKTLDEKVNVQAPTLTGFERKGFAVTEWGAFFKADKAHKDFTCLM